uniref:C3H1-type domain-containing protein n=1 Tax=Meloidogyne enterolobii TaxID=390850 RepID=A0A6V7UZ05_MELEN|nr:unnamed protein product [Meloidogyne enterolobii]
MAFNSKIPIAEINKENINKVWPQLLSAIQQAHIVAIDLEFSGLGDSSNKKAFSDRYRIAKETVKSRTILSLGIATFQRRQTKNPLNISYKCKIFDLLSLESKPFVADPEAFVFLSSHGFDFNRLFSHGIRYTKAANARENIFKSLFEEILASGVSLAVHNGLNDLLFIYEHFYAALPDSVDEFVANIADWFGIVDGSNFVCFGSPTILDSKYLALKNEKFESSYLEYVFRKAQRLNHIRMETLKPYISIKFSKLPQDVRSEILFSRINVVLSNSFLQKITKNVQFDELCKNYSNFGNCRNRKTCQKEHDVDLVLDYEDSRKKTKKDKEKRRREHKAIKRKLAADAKNNGLSKTKKSKIELEDTSEDSETNNSCCVKETTSTEANESSNHLGSFESRGRHRAGMDAFMTGFSVLYFNVDANAKENSSNICLFDANLAARLPLPGKEFPLLLRKPERVRQSESHVLNWGRIQDRRNGFLESRSASYNSNSLLNESH